VNFAAITLCVASQQVFIVVVSLSTQSGNFWIHPRTADIANSRTHTDTTLNTQGKGKGKAVPVLLTEHNAMKAYWVSGSIAPRILDLGTRWR
jgi:hypothetical protein